MNNIHIKKCRNNCNNGTLYSLTWTSIYDGCTHNTETILSLDINPLLEDHIKHILVTMAALE